MKRFTLAVFAYVLALLPAVGARAQAPDADKPFLAPLFGNDMVLQRDAQDPIWGWAEPGQQVTVSMNGKSATAKADADGKWVARIGPFEAGGPFELTVAGPHEVKLTDVLVGDVWVCSGQSNMEMGIGNVRNGTQEIADADHPKLRLFTVPKHIAYQPQSMLAHKGQEAKWLVCTPENIKVGDWGGFSAVGYFFGRDLQKELNIPIGLIHTSWGGTIAEAWTSAPALKQMPDFQKPVEAIESGQEKPQDKNPNRPTVLYNGMINPLVPLAIKGAVWYQGESNADRAAQYRVLLPTMIQDWRGRFTSAGDSSAGGFPFYIVQLAAFQAESEQPPRDSNWADLREAQSLAAQKAGHSAIAVATDIGEANDIHPKNKQEVGRRLALDALALTYGKPVEYAGPTFKQMDVSGGDVTLRFDHAEGLEARGGGPLKGFAIAGDNHQFHWADARIQGDAVVVSSPDVPHPTVVRYGWENNPAKANLVNKAGLPAPPFRTDGPKVD